MTRFTALTTFLEISSTLEAPEMTSFLLVVASMEQYLSLGTIYCTAPHQSMKLAPLTMLMVTISSPWVQTFVEPSKRTAKEVMIRLLEAILM